MLAIDKPKKTFCFFHSLAIVFIPFTFLLGLIFAYLGYIPLKIEAHTLGIISFIFIVFVLFVRHNANYAACHMKGSFTKMEAKLHEALDENALTIMGKRKSTLPVKSFISEYYQDIRNDNFARVASSIFPMLGILGTFIAIALSMPDFTVQDTDSLDREISLLLSGIGTAFYASIYGIMLSLIWTYFEKRGITKIDKQVIDLEKIYSAHVWKESELIKHRHMQSELKDQQIVQTLKETFDMSFIKELNEQYLKNFTTIIHETSENFTKITHHMQEASADLKDTLESIHIKKEGVSAMESMQKNIEGFNTNAKNLQKSMEHFDTSVEHTFQSIDKELAQAVEKLATFTQLLSKQNRDILDTIKKEKKQIDV